MKKHKTGRNPMKQSDIIKRYKELYGDKFDYSLFKYINGRTKSKIKCNTCGVIFKQRPDSHLAGNGCPNCAKKYIGDLRRIEQEEIIKRFIEIHGDNYDYSNVKTNGIHNKVEIICLKENHGSFLQTPNNHLKGHGCPVCKRNNHSEFLTLNREEVIKRFVDLHGDRYGYNDFIYKGQHEKGEIECREHGIFLQTPTNHLKGQGCPGCKRSKGEKFIETILKKLNINFIQEYKIPGYNFEYDFYLPDHKTFIEFNGRQHYEPVEVFGGLEGFKITKRNDIFKKELVKLRNEKLLIFTYKQLNFKELEIHLIAYINNCKPFNIRRNSFGSSRECS